MNIKHTNTVRKVVSLRLNNSELDMLDNLSKKEGLKRSDYLRKLIKNKERVFTLDKEEVSFLKSEFGDLGSLAGNINQIAFHLNKAALVEGDSFTKERLIEIINTKDSVLEQVNILQNRIAQLINIKSD